MKTGFTISQRGNAVSIDLYPPASRNGAPSLLQWKSDPIGAAVIMGRLYYRQDAIRRLGPAEAGGPPPEAWDDAEIVLHTWRQLGVEGLCQLEGDFSLAIVDVRGRKMVGLRDPMGGYPLFWTRTADGVALGTSLGPLTRFFGHRSINREYLAEYLSMFGMRAEGATDQCIYEGIHRVRAGSFLTADLSSLVAGEKRYWNWMDHVEDPGSDRLEDLAAVYHERLSSAVHQRLQHSCLAHLSGGMDSTSIALLGKGLIEKGKCAGPLHTVSLIYDKLRLQQIERPYIEEVMSESPAWLNHRLVADEILDYDDFPTTPLHDEPYPALYRLPMDRSLLEVGHAAGAATVLTGIGADEIHDVQPYFLGDLLRRGRIMEAWKRAGSWAAASNLSKWSLLKDFAFPALGRPWSWLLRGRELLHDKACTDVPGWFDPGFVGEFGIGRRIGEDFRMAQGAAGQKNRLLSMTCFTLDNRPGDVLRWAVGAPLNMAVSHPFLDRRLLSLGLGIQTRLHPDPLVKKPVLAAAMRGVLPDKIAHRRRKGHSGEIYHLGIARNLKHLERLVTSEAARNSGLFDIRQMQRCLEDSCLEASDARRMHRMDLALCLIKWLSCADGWHATAPEPAERVCLRMQ